MNTFKILNEAGQQQAFEIEHAYVSIDNICKILQAGNGISGIVKRKIFQNPSDVHVRFKCDGKDFIVWEPYSDSSRYWIGENIKSSDTEALDKVENLFKSHTPPPYRRILGDVLSLKFMSVFFRSKK